MHLALSIKTESLRRRILTQQLWKYRAVLSQKLLLGILPNSYWALKSRRRSNKKWLRPTNRMMSWRRRLFCRITKFKTISKVNLPRAIAFKNSTWCLLNLTAIKWFTKTNWTHQFSKTSITWILTKFSLKTRGMFLSKKRLNNLKKILTLHLAWRKYLKITNLQVGTQKNGWLVISILKI